MAKEIRASHILVLNETHAKELIDKIKKGDSFEELARQFSKCPSGKNGGDLGFFGKGMMVPEFERAAWSLDKGKFTEKPVKTQFGFHIIKKRDER